MITSAGSCPAMTPPTSASPRASPISAMSLTSPEGTSISKAPPSSEVASPTGAVSADPIGLPPMRAL